MPPEPPYLTIAAELRRRITAGELPPGAKVPSTRKIAGEWGVALATAAKALTTLTREGLVRAEPRSGTVVTGTAPAPAPGPGTGHGTGHGSGSGSGRRVASGGREHRGGVPAASPGRRPGDLTRDRIVRAAIEIADDEGLAALSMRAVAARLAVAPMAPYRYVSGKGHLIALMADAAYGERTYPAPLPADRRARLELCARTLWSLYRAHPWLAHLAPLTRPMALPNLAAHAECALSAFTGLGLTAAEQCDLHVLLFSYIQGVAIHLEREQQALSATGQSEDDWMNSQLPAMEKITASGRYPNFGTMVTTLSTEGYDLVLDDLFELGLRSLLDGLTPRLTPTTT
jgi:AcrR family transcriptional regulator